MNEQATMMNQQQQQRLMNMNRKLMSMNQMNPQPQPQVTKFNESKDFSHPRVIPQSSDLINFHPQMVQMNRSYGMWAQPQQFQNPSPKPSAVKPPPSAFHKPLGPGNNWKGKKVNKAYDKRRAEQQNPVISVGGNLKFNSYNPPTLNDFQHQNRLKARKFFPKKKLNKNNSRSAPFAPRNTTSFLIRAKKSGGIAPLVSPYPATPAVLPTPVLSPSREVLVDMAKEEWGVDGYGSMKGLIRLRSSSAAAGHEHEDEDEDEGSSSESDVEEHVEVERRLDHDLSRFEMISNTNNIGGVLENRVDDQDSHIAQLEEENLILKERLFLMERELRDFRKRMLSLERMGDKGDTENQSDNIEDGDTGTSVDVNINVDTQDKGLNIIHSTDAGSKDASDKDTDKLMMDIAKKGKDACQRVMVQGDVSMSANTGFKEMICKK